jgi:hypothetical protein
MRRLATRNHEYPIKPIKNEMLSNKAYVPKLAGSSSRVYKAIPAKPTTAGKMRPAR